MDGEEERKSKQHRASRAGRGHDKKTIQRKRFIKEIDEKRQEKERAGNRRKKPKVKCNTFLIDFNAFQRLLELNRR